jgi:hypothetical protein
MPFVRSDGTEFAVSPRTVLNRPVCGVAPSAQSGRLLPRLPLQLLDRPSILEPVHGRHAVDDEHALDVIEFVLNTAGQQSAGDEREGFAVDVKSLYRDNGGAKNFAADLRQAEAAFFKRLNGARHGDHGVDERQRAVAVRECAFDGRRNVSLFCGWLCCRVCCRWRHIKHKQPPRQAHLRSSQANALFFMHDAEHALGYHGQVRIGLDGQRAGSQHGRWIYVQRE